MVASDCMDLSVRKAWCSALSCHLAVLALPCLVPALWTKHPVICRLPHLFPGARERVEAQAVKSPHATYRLSETCQCLPARSHLYCPQHPQEEAKTLQCSLCIQVSTASGYWCPNSQMEILFLCLVPSSAISHPSPIFTLTSLGNGHFSGLWLPTIEVPSFD